jgi:hypothetical protein
VEIITMEEERGCTVRALIDDHEKVPIARHETRQPPAPARFHVDDGLPDHRAPRHAADETGGSIGKALANAFLVPARFRVGQVIDDVLCHQAFEQTNDGDSDGIREDDL